VGDYTNATPSPPNETWVDPPPGRTRYKASAVLLPTFHTTFVVYCSLFIPLQSSLWFRIWARCDASSVIDYSLQWFVQPPLVAKVLAWATAECPSIYDNEYIKPWRATGSRSNSSTATIKLRKVINSTRCTEERNKCDTGRGQAAWRQTNNEMTNRRNDVWMWEVGR
jgi:hypothetical protein